MGRKSLSGEGETIPTTIRIPKKLIEDIPEGKLGEHIRNLLKRNTKSNKNVIRIIKKLFEATKKVEVSPDYFTPEEVETIKEVLADADD